MRLIVQTLAGIVPDLQGLSFDDGHPPLVVVRVAPHCLTAKAPYPVAPPSLDWHPRGPETPRPTRPPMQVYEVPLETTPSRYSVIRLIQDFLRCV